MIIGTRKGGKFLQILSCYATAHSTRHFSDRGLGSKLRQLVLEIAEEITAGKFDMALDVHAYAQELNSRYGLLFKRPLTGLLMV